MKQITLVFLFLVSFSCSAQVLFEKGYYINMDGEKNEGFIKNEEWLKAPKSISYKKEIDSKEFKILNTEIKEFGIDGSLKYKNFLVKIYNPNLTEADKRKPSFTEVEILLNKLVEGEANLYVYIGSKMNTSYFVENNNGDLLQLLNFRVKLPNNKLTLYSTYKKDLQLFLKCDKFIDDKLETLSYKKKKLMNLITSYNTCKNNESKFFSLNSKKIIFNFIPKIGLSYNLFSLKNDAIKFNESINGFGYSVASEFEIIFPFNKRKWSFLIEPAYISYEGELESAKFNSEGISVSDSRFKLGLGLRHYFLMKNYQLYATGKFSRPLSSQKSVEFSEFENENEFDLVGFFSLGFGVRLQGRIYTELSIGFPVIEVPADNRTNMNYSTSSATITIGYKLF